MTPRTTPTRIAMLALLTATALGSACDKKPEPAVPASDAGPVTVDAISPAAEAAFPLGAGERFYGAQLATTPLVWKTADGTLVSLALVTTTGKNDQGRELSVLRAHYAVTDGSRKTQDLQTFAVDPAIQHWAELKTLSNGRVLFRFGEADTGPLGRNAAILAWDEQAKRVRLAKRWHGDAQDPEPAWLVTGVYTAAPEAGTACAQVVARIVACGKDLEFREALFRRVPAAERADMLAHLDTHLTSWKKPAEVKAQCARWATDDYVDTHFAEPTRLGRLAKDAKLTCEYFGREIDDEGGLPRSAVDATPDR